MELIKRHKGLAIIGGLTLILVIIMFAIFARMIFSNGNSEYGNRLNGIVEIKKSVTNEVIEETKKEKEVEDVTIRVQGKIIYTTITFKEGTNLNKAKEIASNTLKKYDEEILAYYDLGYFLKENIIEKESEESNGFTVAGTKHPDKEKIAWTKS